MLACLLRMLRLEGGEGNGNPSGLMERAEERSRCTEGLGDNLPQIQVKDLRRHYAIDLAENGADMHELQQVLGHASVAITERYYAQFSPEHSAKKILRVLKGGRAEKKTA